MRSDQAMTPLTCITGATIVTLVDGSSPLSGTDLWIADGRIAALLPAGSPPPINGPVETISVSNALVLPGFVNAHSHSASAILRGTNPGLPVDLYCLEATSRGPPRTARQVRLCVLLQAVEMLKCGITSVVDHFRNGAVPSLEAIDEVFGAYTESGMRVALAPMFDDKLYIDSLPFARSQWPNAARAQWEGLSPPKAEDYFAVMEEAVSHWRGHDRFRLLLGIEAPPRGTVHELELAGDFIARHGIGLHTHLLESKTQAQLANAYGGSLVAYLDRFGLIGPTTSLAHFVWCNARDVEVSAERRVNVVHNPVSNLLFGSGLQPTARLLAAGINVTLGSDGAGGNHINLFEQAKFAMLLSRISEPDYQRWIGPVQALQMAARNGGALMAAVMGELDGMGVIRVGARADLMIIDMASQAYCPLGDIFSHLVMYETGAGVNTVIVGGRTVVRHGRCTWIDEAALLDEASQMARHSNSQQTTRASDQRTHVYPLLLDALRRSLDIDRFAHLD
jgi:5-methylthioadenosine/S-adenosylhomocysteine deaminase